MVWNLCIGYQAGKSIETGVKNIMMGTNAGLNSTASKNIFIGTTDDVSATAGVGAKTTGNFNVMLGVNKDHLYS